MLASVTLRWYENTQEHTPGPSASWLKNSSASDSCQQSSWVNPFIADVWRGRSSHQKPPCLPVSLDSGPEALHWLWPHVLLLILLHPAPQVILCPRAFAPTISASWPGALHDTRTVPWILQIYTKCHLLRNPSPATPVLNWNPRQFHLLSSSLLWFLPQLTLLNLSVLLCYSYHSRHFICSMHRWLTEWTNNSKRETSLRLISRLCCRDRERITGVKDEPKRDIYIHIYICICIYL